MEALVALQIAERLFLLILAELKQGLLTHLATTLVHCPLYAKRLIRQLLQAETLEKQQNLIIYFLLRLVLQLAIRQLMLLLSNKPTDYLYLAGGISKTTNIFAIDL